MGDLTGHGLIIGSDLDKDEELIKSVIDIINRLPKYGQIEEVSVIQRNKCD